MKQQRRICIYNITQYLANIFCLCRIRLTLGSIDFLPRPGSARQLTSEASRGDAPKTCIKLSAHNQMGYGEKRDIDISYTGIYGFHLSCAFSAASLLFNLKRNFCLVPAPPRSPRSGVIEVFVPARRRGTLHLPRTPVSGAMAVGLKKNSGLTRGVLTKFRLAQAPRGSRFLRKPAPCGRGGCAAPLAALGGV